MKQSLGAKPIAYPTPVFLVGSYDADGRANMMNAAWGGICCSVPPCVMVAIREERHSYQAIIDRKAFTINIPSRELVVEADYFGIASGRNQDKLAVAGLTVERSELVDAPLLCAAPLVLECRLLSTQKLGSHSLFVGEICDVKVESSCLDRAGLPDARKIDPLVFAPGNSAYFALGDCVAQAFAAGKKLMP